MPIKDTDRSIKDSVPVQHFIGLQPIPYLQAIQRVHRVPRFREPPFWRHESLQPQGKFCIELTWTAEVAESDSGCHDENLDFGSEGDEEDEEGGRADEERRKALTSTMAECSERALIADNDLTWIGLNHQVQFRERGYLMLSNGLWRHVYRRKRGGSQKGVQCCRRGRNQQAVRCFAISHKLDC